jgi:hypothetical protein
MRDTTLEVWLRSGVHMRFTLSRSFAEQFATATFAGKEGHTVITEMSGTKIGILWREVAAYRITATGETAGA